MKVIPESGYYNSNKFARIFLDSIKEITGKNGLNSVLNYSHLQHLIDNLPPDDLERTFDFAHFAMINQALVELYGRFVPRFLLAPIHLLQIVFFGMLVQHRILGIEAGAPLTRFDEIGHRIRGVSIWRRLTGRARHGAGTVGRDCHALLHAVRRDVPNHHVRGDG